jgi:hypothetical protein
VILILALAFFCLLIALAAGFIWFAARAPRISKRNVEGIAGLFASPYVDIGLRLPSGVIRFDRVRSIALMYHGQLWQGAAIGADHHGGVVFFIAEHGNPMFASPTDEGILWTFDTTPEGETALCAAFALSDYADPLTWNRNWNYWSPPS